MTEADMPSAKVDARAWGGLRFPGSASMRSSDRNGLGSQKTLGKGGLATGGSDLSEQAHLASGEATTPFGRVYARLIPTMITGNEAVMRGHAGVHSKSGGSGPGLGLVSAGEY